MLFAPRSLRIAFNTGLVDIYVYKTTCPILEQREVYLHVKLLWSPCSIKLLKHNSSRLLVTLEIKKSFLALLLKSSPKRESFSLVIFEELI